MYNSQEVANKIKTVAKAQSVTIGQMLSDCSLGLTLYHLCNQVDIIRVSKLSAKSPIT